MSEEVFNSNAIGDKIISDIKTIYDPEISVNIYELGLNASLPIFIYLNNQQHIT